MADGTILSKRDSGRLQQMLRWFEITGKNLRPQFRKRGGATSAAASPPDKWFKLSLVAANPMTGTEYTCTDGVWSQVSGAEATSIYAYPQIDISQYQVNDYVFAVYSGNCWIALYNTPVAFDEC